MKFKEIEKLGDEALVHKELQLERDLIEIRFRHKTGQLEDVSQLAVLRKDIARCRTIQRTRERDEKSPNNALRDKYRSSFKPGARPIAEAVAKSSGFLKGIVDKVKSTD